MILVQKLIIPAEAHTDDDKIKVKFDALPWFQAASAYDIAKLAACGWGGNDPADGVAELCSLRNSELQQLFEYLKIVNHPEPRCGFECHVDQAAALSWLQSRDRRRPPINHDAKLSYRHTLKDNADQSGDAKIMGEVEILIEADPSWASIAIWSSGEHLADVTVELFEGQVVARTYKTEDIDGDPTTRTELCANPNAPTPAVQ
jgi:hypothetical protein